MKKTKSVIQELKSKGELKEHRKGYKAVYEDTEKNWNRIMSIISELEKEGVLFTEDLDIDHSGEHEEEMVLTLKRSKDGSWEVAISFRQSWIPPQEVLFE